MTDNLTAAHLKELLDAGQPHSQIVTISPEMALLILGHNINRRVSPDRVTLWTQTLRQGDFHLLNDAVTIDRDGALANGQHRLTACVETGIPIEVVLLTGVDPDVRDHMDTGMRRTLAQVLRNRGISQAPDYAAALTLHWQYVNNLLTVTGRGGRRPDTPEGERRRPMRALPHALMLHWSDNHPELKVGLDMSSAFRWKLPHLKRSAGTVFCALAFVADPGLAPLFVHHVQYGEGLHAGTPELAVRNKMIAIDRDVPREAMLAMLIKAWNARLGGERMQHVVLRRTEEFPRVETPADAVRRSGLEPLTVEVYQQLLGQTGEGE